jgi:hypothetical protein
MKLNFYKTNKILILCVLLIEIIICTTTCTTTTTTTTTETSTKNKFLFKASMLKNRKKITFNKRSTLDDSDSEKKRINLFPHFKTSDNNDNNDNKDKREIDSLVKHNKDNENKGDIDSLVKQFENRSKELNDNSPIDLNIGNGPVWVSGWIKYFKYFPTTKTHNLTSKNTPKQFMINPEYNEQYKINPNFDKKEKSKDELGNSICVNIPDNNYFYAKLMKNQFIIFSARNV